MTPRQRAVLERWRQSPSVPSGKSMGKVLDQAAEILRSGRTLTILPEVPYPGAC
ncbi:hypothetical protein [Actinomadura sp. 6N118]|uniref:hypothetical protein n=1 Tax=Actinomadura sp. 6N118 TaxID=3375151 RepID=UPI0037C02AC5